MSFLKISMVYNDNDSPTTSNDFDPIFLNDLSISLVDGRWASDLNSFLQRANIDQNSKFWFDLD